MKVYLCACVVKSVLSTANPELYLGTYVCAHVHAHTRLKQQFESI